jgi:hypothetical protein
MNIPEIYLVEPYNAYAPKGKKKHWMQEVEEQALLAKIIAEQQALQEAANRPSNRPSNTLPPQAPPTATATAQAYSGGAGAAGQANSTGGGGGAPRPQFFNPESGSYTFSVTPTTSSAPTWVQFTVVGGSSTLALGGATVTWTFGDGTTANGAGTSHFYTGTGSFVGGVQVDAAINGVALGTSSLAVTLSVPTVTSAFTVTGATVTQTAGYYTASVGDTLTFVNGASTNNPYNTLTYNWTFGSGSAPSSSLANPTFTYSTASTYVVILGVSGSFNAKTTGTRNIQIV